MNTIRHKYLWLFCVALISIFAVQSFDVSIAAASTAPTEGYDKILEGFGTLNGQANSGMQGLSDTLGSFGKGFANVAMVLSVIMTATAAIMVGFGVDDGKKTFWSWILGIGLAINAAHVVQAIFGSVPWMTLDVNPDIPESLKSFSFTTTAPSTASQNSDYFNLTANFLFYYKDGIIYPAAARIVPYACRICLILTCIDISVQLGLQLVEGDKVKFMVSKFLACGIYLFLIANWVGYGNDYSGMQLMNRLQRGMRALGNVAMGTSEAPLGVNNIFGDCIAIASAYFNTIQKAGIVMEIFLGLVGIIVCVMLLLICFEMVMAYFEFWTMALLTLPLLAFGVIPQLKFLSESAIKAMFNLSIKIMCIAFLTGVVSTTINDYTKTVISAADSNWNNSSIGLVSGFAENVSNSISLLVVVGMMWILVRKMPALIQGLLQGNPSLSSGDMMGTLTGAMNSVGGAAGRVSAAMGGGSGGGGESGGGDAGGGGGSGGSGGGNGSAASSPKGKMQALKNAGTTLASAAATGGAGAVAKAGGKMLKGAAKSGLKSAVKGTGNVAKGIGKAGIRYGQRNLPGLKGYYDGKYAYSQESNAMGKDAKQKQAQQDAQQAQQRYNNLSDMRDGMSAFARAIGGDGAEKKFQQEFDKSMGFQPKSKPPASQNSSNAAGGSQPSATPPSANTANNGNNSSTSQKNNSNKTNGNSNNKDSSGKNEK